MDGFNLNTKKSRSFLTVRLPPRSASCPLRLQQQQQVQNPTSTRRSLSSGSTVAQYGDLSFPCVGDDQSRRSLYSINQTPSSRPISCLSILASSEHLERQQAFARESQKRMFDPAENGATTTAVSTTTATATPTNTGTLRRPPFQAPSVTLPLLSLRLSMPQERQQADIMQSLLETSLATLPLEPSIPQEAVSPRPRHSPRKRRRVNKETADQTGESAPQ